MYKFGFSILCTHHGSKLLHLHATLEAKVHEKVTNIKGKQNVCIRLENDWLYQQEPHLKQCIIKQTMRYTLPNKATVRYPKLINPNCNNSIPCMYVYMATLPDGVICTEHIYSSLLYISEMQCVCSLMYRMQLVFQQPWILYSTSAADSVICTDCITLHIYAISCMYHYYHCHFHRHCHCHCHYHHRSRIYVVGSWMTIVSNTDTNW